MNWPFRQALLWGVRSGFALLLLTPLIVSAETVFPHVLGKAVYSRAIVEVTFLLWALLALTTPAFRPPRSWLLLLLFAGLAAAALAAGMGVSPQRSFWSSYQRMDGVIGMAHWAALALALACSIRSSQEWRVFLNLSVGAGLAAILLVTAAWLEIAVPYWGALGERDHPRIGGPFGNATFQGTFSSLNAIVALGLLTRSFHREAGAAPTQRPGVAARLWGKRLFWAGAATASLWALTLSGTRSAAIGLAAAALAICLLYAMRAPRRARIAAGAATLAIATLGAIVAVTERTWRYDVPTSPMARLLHVDLDATSLATRWRTWQTGLQAFVEKPALGLGPDNYGVAYGRHIGAAAAQRLPVDRAHNHLIEKAATEGALGLFIHIALWVCIFRAFLRALRLPGRSWVLPAFVGAALLADFIQDLLLIDSHPNRLQHMMLFAFAVAVEQRACPPARWPASLSRIGERLAAALRHRGARGAAGSALALSCLGGLVVNAQTYAAARTLPFAVAVRNEPAPPARQVRAACLAYEQAIAAFEPLANYPRRMLFAYLAAGERESNWVRLRALEREAAARVLAGVDAQAAAAVAAEPENWRIQLLLARLYRAVAITEPRYRDTAERHAARFAALAPGMEIDSDWTWQRP